jgi:hypothetical protein
VTRWYDRDVVGMRDLVEREMAGRLEGVLVGGGEALDSLMREPSGAARREGDQADQGHGRGGGAPPRR